MQIIVTRTSKTSDGIFGTMTIDSDPFTCVTCENLKDEIPAGTYDVEFTYSPEFSPHMPNNAPMPLLDVPNRTAVRIHWANLPSQLLGCIAVGLKVDGDAVDTSKAEFLQLYAIIKDQTDLTIQVVENYAE
jgi:hypothetical protein